MRRRSRPVSRDDCPAKSRTLISFAQILIWSLAPALHKAIFPPAFDTQSRPRKKYRNEKILPPPRNTPEPYIVPCRVSSYVKAAQFRALLRPWPIRNQ